MKTYKLNKDINLDDHVIYIKSLKALVFSDLHIGYEETLHKQGLLLPRFHYADIKKKIQLLIKKYKPEKIIILGDIQHEFKRPKFEVTKKIRELLDYCADKAELLLLKGNHEKTLKLNTLQRHKLRDYIRLGDYFFTHGHLLFNKNNDFKKSKQIICGHQHSSITLHDLNTKESYKCFLKGKYKDKDLLVLPSLNLITVGFDVLQDEVISPYILNMQDMNVYVIGKNILDFGLVKDLKDKL